MLKPRPHFERQSMRAPQPSMIANLLDLSVLTAQRAVVLDCKKRGLISDTVLEFAVQAGLCVNEFAALVACIEEQQGKLSITISGLEESAGISSNQLKAMAATAITKIITSRSVQPASLDNPTNGLESILKSLMRSAGFDASDKLTLFVSVAKAPARSDRRGARPK